ncbi:hypothetical protein HYW18_02950 [Candidatus Uhrbacteria bacterium]|nr:hypothetical protein [Candidatus Uhrbacteria bacterium]
MSSPIFTRNAFLHLLAFISFYWAVVGLITLYFQIVNALFPDPLIYQDMTFGAMRWGISSVVIAFPVFVVTMRFIRSQGIIRPHFPIYFTLFVTGVTAMIDLATLVYHLTGGDLTTRFILKALAVLVVAGSVFAYEWWHLKHDALHPSKRARFMFILVYILLALSVVDAFWVIGLPNVRRSQSLDERRVNDLRSLQWEVLSLYQRDGELPETLDMLVRDPGTSAAYEYRPLDLASFELCATFDRASTGKESPPYMGRPIAETSDIFTHGAGYTCFARTVEADPAVANEKIYRLR